MKEKYVSVSSSFRSHSVSSSVLHPTNTFQDQMKTEISVVPNWNCVHNFTLVDIRCSVLEQMAWQNGIYSNKYWFKNLFMVWVNPIIIKGLLWWLFAKLYLSKPRTMLLIWVHEQCFIISSPIGRQVGQWIHILLEFSFILACHFTVVQPRRIHTAFSMLFTWLNWVHCYWAGYCD